MELNKQYVDKLEIGDLSEVLIEGECVREQIDKLSRY